MREKKTKSKADVTLIAAPREWGRVTMKGLRTRSRRGSENNWAGKTESVNRRGTACTALGAFSHINFENGGENLWKDLR
ncbi:MAG: hypothetical protein ACRENF_07075 [Thermodesulfobacteriota bacterium]